MPYRHRKEDILRLLDEGKSYREIQREIGCSKGTIAYHIRAMGGSRTNEYDWNSVQSYLDSGHTKEEAQSQFGFGKGAWYYAIRAGKIRSEYLSELIPLDDLLVDGRLETSRHHLKKRILDAGIMEYICKICGINEWLGVKIVLHLDHINGHNKDNRIDNLRLLCPNCHSQTDTYCGRNIPKKKSWDRLVVDRQVVTLLADKGFDSPSCDQTLE